MHRDRQLPRSLDGDAASAAPRRSQAGGMVAAVFGLLLFAWFVRRVGPGEILAGLRQIGWGLIVVVAIAGARFVMRALAWSWCVEPPHRLPLAAAIPAVISGDSVGNLTPFGPLVGEPAKAAFVRQRVPLAPALTALAIENLLYALSVAIVIAAAMIALLLGFDLPGPFRHASEFAVAGILAALSVALWMLWWRPSLVSRALAAIAPSGSAVDAKVDRVRALEQEIYTFASRRPGVLGRVAAAELGFHALGVLEVHVTWWLMQGTAPPLLVSFILEGANRLITVVFKFVPLQLGVAEAGTAAFTQLLGYGAAPGATLAIARKARVLFWTAAGTLLLVRRGFRAAPPRTS